MKKGDVVKYLSTGCQMTVEKISENKIDCVWFIGDELHRQPFDKKDLIFIK